MLEIVKKLKISPKPGIFNGKYWKWLKIKKKWILDAGNREKSGFSMKKCWKWLKIKENWIFDAGNREKTENFTKTRDFQWKMLEMAENG
ncbi:unnamed protein product [Caenorhabditis angaria]|uniref:Uncharacterized protein n=1 Tax=Caenorhabditis angaria TaxID=860376 RepID=A0A9P1IQB5_9PELO|nr:unnamed protein product [Caenorhabditis angaria]